MKVNCNCYDFSQNGLCLFSNTGNVMNADHIYMHDITNVKNGKKRIRVYYFVNNKNNNKLMLLLIYGKIMIN